MSNTLPLLNISDMYGHLWDQFSFRWFTLRFLNLTQEQHVQPFTSAGSGMGSLR